MIFSLRDEWLSELEAGALSVAPEGIEFSTQDAQNDAAKQMQMIEAARNAGNDAIIINLVDPSTAEQMAEAAGDVPVVFVNRVPTDESAINENAIYVGSDENTSGAFQAEYLTEYFQAQGKTEFSYILLNGTLGQTSTELRTSSLLKGFEEAGMTAIEATAPIVCEYDRATAMDMFTPLIGITEYDCIISNNDAMALGAIEALESKGVDPSEKPIVGIDASADGRASIEEGKLAMSVFQDPIGQGSASILAAINMIEGNPIQEGTGYDVDETGNIIWVPFEPVTIDNVADYQ